MTTMPGDTPVIWCADMCRNHGGSIAVAREMVHQASLAGATMVKFQADDGLLRWWRFEGIQEAKILGLLTSVTVREEADVEINTDWLKIGSGECLNRGILTAVMRSEKPWIISTGCTTRAEYDEIALFADGIMCECVSSYPNEPSEIRLGFLREQIKERLMGYSDHMPDDSMALAAVALGAVYIEKHLSLDPLRRDLNHSSSISPAAFQAMTRKGNGIAAAMKNTEKEVLPREVTTGKLAEYRQKYTSEPICTSI